jgi:hypothetical protein
MTMRKRMDLLSDSKRVWVSKDPKTRESTFTVMRHFYRKS